MTQDEKQELLKGLFQGANLEHAQVNVVVESGAKVVYQEVHADKSQSEVVTDEQIAEALTNIVGKGKPIDSKQKWAGAHWFLRWACNYPVKAQDFCLKIDSLHLPEDLEFKCEYRNIREFSTLSFMNEDARYLDSVRYSQNDEAVYFQMKDVVNALRTELHRIHMRR